MSQAADFLPIAHRLADAARAVILPYYRGLVAIDDKADSSPVTLADRGAEQAMRALLAELLPEHGVIGEEFGAERDAAEWVWVLDPVDGTKSFIVGRPTFCTLIGLLHRGKPVLGVIDQPVLDERWIGVVGQGTTLNGRPVASSTIACLTDAKLASTDPQFLPGEAGERLKAQTRFTVWGGDAYLFALLASGGVDIEAECGLKLHDFAALAPVIEGAGGVISDWQGKPLDRHSAGDVLAAANPVLHAAALVALRGD
jgi:histidinol phosphatase-like enzyme (inositol monophosphatase family)